MPEIERLSLDSGDPDAERKQQLAELFPEAFEDGKIDIDALRDALGDIVDDGDERYAFTWPGKRDAIRQSQIPSTATLRPQKDKSVDWDDTKNIYIEGDNLEVLKLLQHSYHGKVKMIYIDPPYNTGHDFVYKDTFGDSVTNYKEQAGLTAQSNPDTSGRYHSNWCSMLYPRLKLARELLTDDGVIAVSIDDNELTDLLCMMREIFGEANLLATFPRVTKKAGKSSEAIAQNHDYLVLTSKSGKPTLFPPKQTGEDDYPFRDEYFDERGPYKLNQCLDYDSLQYSAALDYPITIQGETLYPGGDYSAYQERKAGNHARADWAWRWSKEKYSFGLAQGFVVLKHSAERPRIYTKTYLNATIEEAGGSSKKYAVKIAPRTKSLSTLEYVDNKYSNDNANKGLASIFSVKGLFDYSKPTSLVKSLISFCTQQDDIVLDFFSGSATTAQATIEQNKVDSFSRSFILVQLPEPFNKGSVANRNGYATIAELGEERIRRAGKKIAEEVEQSNQQLEIGEEPKKVPDVGFRVFSLDESGIRRPEASQSGTLFDAGTLFDNVVKPGRSDEDIIFEMMLKWGLDLSLPIEKVEAAGYPCYSVACGELVCCMADGLTMEALEAIAAMEPRRVLMLDSILTDTLKLNAIQVFRRVGERTGVEVELRTV